MLCLFLIATTSQAYFPNVNGLVDVVLGHLSSFSAFINVVRASDGSILIVCYEVAKHSKSQTYDKANLLSGKSQKCMETQ